MASFLRSKLFREILIYVVVAVIAFGIASAVRSGSNPSTNEETERVAGVSVTKIEAQNTVEIPYSVNGPVRAEQSTDIHSVVSGTVLSLTGVGTRVAQGGQLFRLSNPSIEQGYFAALTSLANAQSSASQSGFATESQLAEARIRVSSAELALEGTRQTLVDAEITGQISIRQAEDSAKVAYDSAYRSLETAMRFLGGPNLDGFVYDDATSNYTGGIGLLRNQFDSSVIVFKQVPRFPSGDMSGTLQNLEAALVAAKDFGQTAWTYLRLAVPNPFYSQAALNSAVSSVGNTVDSLNTADTQVKTARNGLRAAREQNNAQLSSLRNQVKSAETALANTRQSLATQAANIGVSNLGAQNQINAARAQLAAIQYQYDNLALSSPFAGTVISHGITLGSQVNPGQPLLTLGNLNIVEVRVEVSPEIASAVRLGQQVEIEGNRVGRVSEIEAAGSLATGSVGITIEADNVNNQFTPGTSVQVTLSLTYEINNSYIIPLSAVTVTQTETYALIAEGGKAVKRQVATNRVLGEFIEIISGLKVGDEVITTRPGLLQEGERVEINN